jgi:hypothetical protein
MTGCQDTLAVLGLVQAALAAGDPLVQARLHRGCGPQHLVALVRHIGRIFALPNPGSLDIYVDCVDIWSMVYLPRESCCPT